MTEILYTSDSEAIEIDRDLLSHGDTKRAMRIQYEIRQLDKPGGDVDRLFSLLDEAERMMERVIISIPDTFYMPGTPDDQKLPAPGWMNNLKRPAYERITSAMRPVMEQGEPGTEGN